MTTATKSPTAPTRKPRKPRKATAPVSLPVLDELMAQIVKPARASKTKATLAPAPAPAAAPRAPRPNSERRNELTHPEGRAAVEHFACPSCKARKGKRCRKADGVTETNHVHAGRMARFDAMDDAQVIR